MLCMYVFFLCQNKSYYKDTKVTSAKGPFCAYPTMDTLQRRVQWMGVAVDGGSIT